MTVPDHEELANDPETFRRLAAYVGLSLDDARLAEVRPRVEAYRRLIARLEEVDVRGIEPALIAAPLGD